MKWVADFSIAPGFVLIIHDDGLRKDIMPNECETPDSAEWVRTLHRNRNEGMFRDWER